MEACDADRDMQLYRVIGWGGFEGVVLEQAVQLSAENSVFQKKMYNTGLLRLLQ